MDGRPLGVPVAESLDGWLADNEPPPVFVVGVAFSGGRIPERCRPEIAAAIRHGMTVVNGLHQWLADDQEFAALAAEHGATLVDIRKPRPTGELRFWTGDVLNVRAKVVPVLGTDCAVGKRTTARFLWQACNAAGIRTEMIYTGQTGWMQGYPHGFIFDATPNDFISGEIERVILEAEAASHPELILIEGQGSLRNPSGPAGSEFILSGSAAGVILMHDPARKHFVDQEEVGTRVPEPAQEIALIRMFGGETLAVGLNGRGWDEERMKSYQRELSAELGIPVFRPLEEGVDDIVPVLIRLLEKSRGRS
jgi:uncharacterized NAD-dependent epimerase/dehydratase family protein